MNDPSDQVANGLKQVADGKHVNQDSWIFVLNGGLFHFNSAILIGLFCGYHSFLSFLIFF